MKRSIHLFVLIFLFVSQVFAQDNFGKVRLKKIEDTKQKTADQSIFYNDLKPIPGTEFRLIKTQTDKLGMKHRTYQQYYNGLKVHFGTLKMHERNGLRETYNGAYFNPTGVSSNPSISISQARNVAKSFIKSNDVFWIGDDDISKTKIPTPELLILPNRKEKTMHLAYAIGLGTSTPELKMGIVYVDAQTGKVLKYKNMVSACFDANHGKENKVHKTNSNSITPLASGTGATAYSGSQTIETTLDTDYILYDQTRANTGQSHNHGAGSRNGIVTVNFNNHDDINDYHNATYVSDFTDNNNNWTAGEMNANEDQYALDAHWGAQIVYEYWKNEHGRNSYDGNDASIVSYVHFDTDYTNAGWVAFNSSRGFMIYGDGGGSFTPLTNLDVVGHEIGHGVTNANSDLDYELESGALNEGFSDIWAMVIDNYANNNYGTSKNIDLINDENGGGAFRSMSNPNAYGQPDTYGGTYWYDVSSCTPDGTNNDYCGVHTNSGVLNYWFWLLSQGGSGTNDLGDSFNVTTLGINNAADIAYRMESVYLTATSDYAATRNAGIQAAQDLFGYCSPEEEAVTNAFYAVGVGAGYTGNNPVVTIDTSNQTVCVDEIATFTAEANFANTMVWQNDASGSWADLSDDATYSGTTTNSLMITNPSETLDGIRFRIQFTNNCGTTSTTNNRYLNVNTIPNVTSVITNGAGCSSSTDGSLTVTFDDVVDMTNLEFSVDGGTSYPYNFDDTTGTQTITGLAAGDYDVWVRRGNNDCPRVLGTYTVASVPTVTATLDSEIEADVSQNDGIINVSFPDVATQANVKFSTDGGATYPYSFDDTLGTGELTGLGAGTYDVWVSFGDDSCQKSLGNFTVNEMAYTQIPDANFENALNNLAYDNYIGDAKVPTSLISTITSLNVRLENIADLTGIEAFTALEDLYADNNNLISIDVSSNTALKQLIVYNNNNLSSFTVADPSIITRVTFSNCNLTGDLDFSSYTSLTNFSVQNNDLTGLNLKNGNNTNFTYFHAGGNGNLNCIIVDDAAYSTTNWTNNGGATFTDADFCNYTLVPDLNFENALEALGYDDISSDGQVPTALIEVVTTLDVSSQAIADLTGIEDFLALTDLNCESNLLTTLDVSSNTNLQEIDFDNNSVVNPVFGANTNLDRIEGRYNQMTTFDVSQNTGLTFINIRTNPLTGIDLSNNSNLQNLTLIECTLTALDLTANVNLTHVYIRNNTISSIDLSQNALLEVINLNYNGLTNVDVSNNSALRTLSIEGNGLTELDVSINTALTNLNCLSNNLSSLNVQNGNNTSFTAFDATTNPLLTCILVDDAAYSTTNWTSIDGTASFSDTYCEYTAIPDANFEAALDALGYDNITSDGQVPTALIEMVTSLNVNGQSISDLTGIEDFTALVDLKCHDNNLTTLDVTNSLDLEELRCYLNPLTSLDVTGLTELDFLNARDTDLTTLDLTTNGSLLELKLFETDITSIDLSQNVLLEKLECNNTLLTSLDLSSHDALTRLIADNNASLTSLNVRNGNNTNVSNADFNITSCPNLSCVQVDDAAYSTTNWANIDGTTSFSDFCQYTAIPDAVFEARLEALGYDDISGDGQVPTALIEVVTSLNITNDGITDLTGLEDFRDLTNLLCSNNALGTLDVSSNTKLVQLNAHTTSLTSIDLSNNLLIENVVLYGNAITSIDVSNNLQLRILDLFQNQLTSLDLSLNTALVNLYCDSNNNLSYLNVRNGNNTNVTNFVAHNNSSLTCILVDDAAYSTANWTNIDITASFSDTYCLYTAIPDANFEAALDVLGYDDIPADGQVPTVLIEVVTSLDVGSQSIADLTGIEDFAALTSLRCHDNSIQNLDLTNNTFLEFIKCNENGMDTLDLTGLTNFEELVGYYNDFTSFDFSSNPNLFKVSLFGNNLTTLDLSGNSALTFIRIDQNNLTNLDVRNGTNTNITYFNTNSNSNLSCILVDDATYSTANWTLINSTTSFSDTYCRYTAIPDANFEAALDALGYDDIASDGQVPTALIEVVTSLDVNGNTIADMTGIEDFVALEDLNVINNNLTTLDLSNNLQLRTIDTENNPLVSIDVSQNILLEELYCEQNQLTTIDVSNNLALRILDLDDNNLSSINVNANTALTTLDLSDNAITSIDISNNVLLDFIGFENNGMTGDLNLVNHTQIVAFAINDNNITSLNIKNGANNNILFLNTVNNPNLTCIVVDDTAYSTTNWTNIDVTTGFSDTYCRYTAIPDIVFEASLEALGYDDISADGQVPTVLIESVTSLNINGDGVSDLTGIEDFIAIKTLNCRNNNLTSIDVSNNLLLEVLWLASNSLSSIDVSNNPLLTRLEVTGSNLITSLDLSNNPQLELLEGNNTSISSIDFSNNLVLEDIDLRDTQLTSIDVSLQTALVTIRVSNNPNLSYLNVKNGNNTNITVFQSASTPNLSCILVDDAAYSTTNWTNIHGTNNFSDTYCRYTYVPDDNFELTLFNGGYDDVFGDDQVPTVLIEVITNITNYAGSAPIADITGIEDFAALEILTMEDHTFTTADLSSNQNLRAISFKDTPVANLNISSNTGLENLRLENVSMSTLDVSNNTALEILNISEMPSFLAPDLITNTSLRDLTINDIDLSAGYDISHLVNLEYVSFFNTSLNSIDLTSNTSIQGLYLPNNDLTQIDISHLSALTDIYLSENPIAELDLSANTNLLFITLDNMPNLSVLNMKNGNNTSVFVFSSTNTPNLSCILVDNATYSTTNWTNVDIQTTFNEISCAVVLAPKVFLQGAALNPNIGEENLMRDDLRVAGLIPTTSPYSDGLTCTSDVFNTTGANAIVDWVFIELRDPSDTTNILASQSALLQRDGDIVAVDGTSPITINANEGNYYIAIKHRNHLGILTASSVTLTSTVSTLDLSSNIASLTGGALAVKDMGNGIYAMYAGDVTTDGNILNTDISNALAASGTIDVYTGSDVNMDGNVLNTDIALIIQPNAGRIQQF